VALTPDQTKALEELHVISTIVGYDLEMIRDPARADWVSADINDSREMIIRGYLVTEFTVLDELMDRYLLRYFLEEDLDSSLGELRDAERGMNFIHHVLQNLYLLQKFALFEKVEQPPMSVRQYIQRVNDLRNAVAHTFVIEKRRSAPTYKGLDIFSIDGLTQFALDGNDARAYLSRTILGLEPPAGGE
jgi:hypothetical protein